ncbi:hypothetical protein SNE40_002674 [Patella caerulea]|uniref:Uncharacterized protein n=1 Tax=Patella caerulea TaxID=87958 RepID=A0AAN8K6D2_PATCE
MSKLTRSNSNLNNKNNLANVFLKQRLAQFDREQKYSIYHIERNKSSTNHFLTQIKQCDNFITTGSLELLGKNKEKKVEEEEELEEIDCIDGPDKPPQTKPCKRISTSCSPVKIPDCLPIRHQHRTHNISTIKSEWIREGSRKKLSDFERGEMFLAKLREKERYLASLQQTTSDEDDDYNPLLRNAKSGISRLPGFKKGSNRPFSTGDRTNRSRKPSEHLAKKLDFEKEPKTQTVVKFPRVSETGQGPGVAWQDESPRGEDMMRVFLNIKMKLKPKPLHCRIDDFYGKLDEMKKKQDERMKSLPYYEKRRRWLLLTRGNDDGLSLEESDCIH